MPNVCTKEFEYNKKVFNKYYRGKFKYRNLALYIVFQILTTMFLIVPGIMFAIIYWGISNPITKYLYWKEELKYNKGLISKYQFIFNEDYLTIKRNNEEELTVEYKVFKKIKNDKKGIYLLSKDRDFFIPMSEVENLEELANILEDVSNAKIKLPKVKAEQEKVEAEELVVQEEETTQKEE